MIEGLQKEVSTGSYRCSNCHTMQRPGSILVYVPDGTLMSDPAWAVTERAKRKSLNGQWSGWCTDCVGRLEASPELTPNIDETFKGLLTRLMAKVVG
jgi:hypothetical protein